MRPLLTILLAGAIAGCGNRAARVSPATCEPFDGEVRLTSSAISRLAGEYAVTLIATSGDRSGDTARGRLSLAENPHRLRTMAGPGGPMQNVTVPFYGTTNLDLSSVGAVDMGDTQSDDTMSPGVLAVHHTAQGTNTLVMRLGSDANRRDRIRFDGGYSVLRVQAIMDSVILGTWASGITTEMAAGFFCARTI